MPSFFEKLIPRKKKSLEMTGMQEIENNTSEVSKSVFYVVHELADLFQSEGNGESVRENLGNSWLLQMFYDQWQITQDGGVFHANGFDESFVDRVRKEVQNPDFFVHQNAYSNPHILKVFLRVMETPELQQVFFDYTGFWPQRDQWTISSQSLYYLFALSLQMDVHDFSAFQDAYQGMGIQREEKNEYQTALLRTFSFLANKTRDMKSFFEVLDNPFVQESSFEGSFLQKFTQILELVEQREDILGVLMRDNGEGEFDVSEYNDAILRRLSLLVREASAVSSKKEMKELVKNSELFAEDILMEGSVFRGNARFFKEMSFEEISDVLFNVRAEGVRGGMLIKDSFDMENSENYLSPEKFGISDYQMIIRNLEVAYADEYLQYLEVLKLNIAKDLQDEDVEFRMLKYQDELIGVTKIKKLGENEFYLGTFYIEGKFQRDFKIGNVLENSVFETISAPGNIVRASVAPNNPALERHQKSGWDVVGEKTEKAIRKDGTIAETETLFALERRF